MAILVGTTRSYIFLIFANGDKSSSFSSNTACLIAIYPSLKSLESHHTKCVQCILCMKYVEYVTVLRKFENWSKFLGIGKFSKLQILRKRNSLEFGFTFLSEHVSLVLAFFRTYK